MYKIVCDYCNEDAVFKDLNNRPVVCNNCHTPFDGSVEPLLVDDDEYSENSKSQKKSRLKGIELTYQKNGKKINLVPQDEIILGGEAMGYEVLSEISYVSAIHCKLNCGEGICTVTDLGSTNGTFLGFEKIDCYKNPGQRMDDGSLLFLGRELFVVKLLIMSSPVVPEIDTRNNDVEDVTDPYLLAKENRPQIYKCRNCGEEYEKLSDICPNCNTYGSLE